MNLQSSSKISWRGSRQKWKYKSREWKWHVLYRLAQDQKQRWYALTTVCSKVTAWSPGVSVANHTVDHTVCGTSVDIKWKCAVGHNAKFWSSHNVNGVLASDLEACAADFSFNIITLPSLKGLTFVSRSTFCHAQRVHHILAIIDECWAKDNNQLGITKPKCCCYGWIGQYDSPEITAKSPNGNDNWLYHLFGGS